LQLIDVMQTFIKLRKQQMAIRMPGSTTPEGRAFNQDHVVAELCHGRRLPDTQPVFKAVNERYAAFSSGKPQKFRWCRDSSHSNGTWKACKFA